MALVDQQLSEQFYRWEMQGRGWKVHDEPVFPEPPLVPFFGHYLHSNGPIDDARRPTVLSSFVQRLSTALAPRRKSRIVPEDERELEPRRLEREPLIELQLSVPTKFNAVPEAFAKFFDHLSLCAEPIAFELIGTSQATFAQFATSPRDAGTLHQQLVGYFPDVLVSRKQGELERAWRESNRGGTAIVEFGLGREFMFPLCCGASDPFVAIAAALASVTHGELGVFQVLFQRCREPWAENINRSLTGEDGEPFFANSAELIKAARDKVGSPLYAAVVRIASCAESFDRAWELARDLASALRVFAQPAGNELVPLINDGYPFDAHEEDVLRRQSRRCGMILNAEELCGFVHLPTAAVRSPKFRRDVSKTKPAPALAKSATGVLLGQNVHMGESVTVRIAPDQRVRHMHVIGASGTGKSTLLLNLICQDIQSGAGVAVLDPHGDLIDRILENIPESRIDDVVLIDPSDEDYTIGFNILSAHSDIEKNLLASDLVSVFERLSTSWGDQMASVLRNGIMAFLESECGGTLADLRRFLLDPRFRSEFLETVTDPDIAYYWQKGFPQLGGNKSIGPVLTRLENFLGPKPIRYMVSQPENRLDFGEIIDKGRIFLGKLSQGQIGRENAYLLGSLFVAKFQQLAMSRQRLEQSARRDFWFYIDEFQHFVTPSMAEILTSTRKYRMGLVLAHQELRQLDRFRDVASAVLSNAYTRVCFRVGDDDARKLADGFSYFEARDLQNLNTGEAICRVERSDGDFNLSVPWPETRDPLQAVGTRKRVVEASRKRYATPRTEVEALLSQHPPKSEEPRKSAPAKPKAKETKLTPSAVAPASTSDVSKTSEPSKAPEAPNERDASRGQHQACKDRIARAAEQLQYAVRIEEPVPGGRVDAVLERCGRVIACEVSLQNAVEYELANIQKCLAAGFSQVAVICADQRRLDKLHETFLAATPHGDARVSFYLIQKFIAQLSLWAKEQDAAGEKPQPGKRVFELSAGGMSDDERLKREREMLEKLKKAMKRS